MNKPNTVLELLSDPTRWIQGNYARNAKGNKVNYDSDTATCWCLSGSIAYIYGIGHEYTTNKRALEKAIDVREADKLPKKVTVVQFNDNENTTHDDIIHVLELAGI